MESRGTDVVGGGTMRRRGGGGDEEATLRWLEGRERERNLPHPPSSKREVIGLSPSPNSAPSLPTSLIDSATRAWKGERRGGRREEEKVKRVRRKDEEEKVFSPILQLHGAVAAQWNF